MGEEREWRWDGAAEGVWRGLAPLHCALLTPIAPHPDPEALELLLLQGPGASRKKP